MQIQKNSNENEKMTKKLQNEMKQFMFLEIDNRDVPVNRIVCISHEIIKRSKFPI